MPPDDYNIAPSTFQPVIRESRDDGSREMVLMRWGLIPFFTKQLSDVKGKSTINAKAENVVKSPTWREPMKKRRCLVPASAFYEWKKLDAKTKQPYAFTVNDGSLFAFAGLWDAWKDAQGHWLQSFAIVTTEANELMSRVHTRMPVILHPRDYDRWLSREVPEQPPVDLLRPFDSDDMAMAPANKLVGNVRNNGPEMLNSA
jgi:putative SOS response-associated peptidase YedK